MLKRSPAPEKRKPRSARPRDAAASKATQELVYYPKQEGLEQATAIRMHFLDFSRKLLEGFRELHRLNHLTRCLFVHCFLKMMHGVAGTEV